MKNSLIEWLRRQYPNGITVQGHTFNPWEGCCKVSEGCKLCYAENRNKRWNGGTAINWGKGAPRRRTSEANWKEPLKWNREAEKLGVQVPVFCASLADWLDDEVPIEWLADLMELIYDTPRLDWLLLTKRPQNWGPRMQEVVQELGRRSSRAFMMVDCWLSADVLPAWDAIPHNIWIGVSVEDQKNLMRAEIAGNIPAICRFISYEPALGAVNWDSIFYNPDGTKRNLFHWLICGGESGHGARPMHPAWVQGSRDQCQRAGVAFFFKQWGEWQPGGQGNFGGWEQESVPVFPIPRERGEQKSLYINGKIAFMGTPERNDWTYLCKVGKHDAGRLLDGREHDDFPAPTLSPENSAWSHAPAVDEMPHLFDSEDF